MADGVTRDEYGALVVILGGESAMLTPEGLSADGFDHHAVSREAALRLLAAEASSRLGWVWEVKHGYALEQKEGRATWGPSPVDGTPMTAHEDDSFSPDELLAALHGSFLLADAMKQEGV